MKAAIHYKLKVKLIRLIKNEEIDFIELEEEFENENPIEAREKALSKYQSFIEVLLEGKDKKYTSHGQARIDLTSFIAVKYLCNIELGGVEVNFNDSFGNGIGVFMVIDQPIEHEIHADKSGDEYLIHGIGRIGSLDDPQTLMDGLDHEFLYYEHFDYNTNNYKREVAFSDDDASETDINEILDTPFDWAHYDPQHAALESHSSTLVPENELLIFKRLIAQGENSQVEFKPTLIYNFSSGKGGISIKGFIAKAICAFLNSRGGFLFIGVSDSGTIQGLDYDYKLAGEKNPKDFFLLEFDQMVSNFLSFSVKSNIEGKFCVIDNKEIFVVEVSPSYHRPVFLNGQSGKEFYVRGEASTQQLKDLEQIVNYCIDQWSSQ